MPEIHAATPRDVYAASDAAATKALYARLEACGPAGQIGLCMFRAHRCIAQAFKCNAGYQKNREVVRKAYERKDWAINILVRTLMTYSRELRIPWGWCCDSRDKVAPWTLHIDLPQGQVVFRNPRRLPGYDYFGRRDIQDNSEDRIFTYCEDILRMPSKGKSLDLF